ncbi:MAG TPA: adenylate/guanylate cyclase domain-containing protein [Candidatus Binataceae bacterium]|nr:adenylate/guanylate cyclase domain-containing protein [Candidatus Binataceae bacterium]
MNYRIKMIIWLFLSSFVSAAAAIAMAHVAYRPMLAHERRNKVLTLARGMAAMLDGDVEKNFNSRAAEQTAEFKNTRDLLRRARDANRNPNFYVFDALTLVPSPDHRHLLVYGADPQENLKLASHPGEGYAYPETPLEVGTIAAERDLFYGPNQPAVQAAYAPIFDSSGKPVAELEIDTTGDSLKPPLRAHEWTSLVGLLGGAGVGLLCALMMAPRFSRPLEALGQSFRGYIPPPIVEGILRGVAPKITGERKRITVLFSDIRGFTSMSEGLRPEEVVTRLSEYFEHAVEVATRNHGFVDKFLGDGMMVIFGAPTDDPYQAEHAVTAAIEMQQEAERLSQKWATEGKGELRVGIGINSGSAIVGNIGSSQRFEYTAIGSTVNVAQRLEAATKDLGVSILVSEATYEDVKPSFRFDRKSPVKVKGISEPMVTYAVEGSREEFPIKQAARG